MRIEDVKHAMNQVVLWRTPNGALSYLLTGCILRKNEHGYFYLAELCDVDNDKSVLICRLEEIEEAG